MRLKIPPAFVFLFFALLMYLVATYLPVGDFKFFGRSYVLKGIGILGLIIIAVAWIQFYRQHTTIDPMKPSKATTLVTSGIYRYTRNPIYLGLLLFLLSWGLYLGNAFNTLIAAAFVGYMNAYQIKPEEEALLGLFGEQFKQYCVAVRRWF